MFPADDWKKAQPESARFEVVFLRRRACFGGLFAALYVLVAVVSDPYSFQPFSFGVFLLAAGGIIGIPTGTLIGLVGGLAGLAMKVISVRLRFSKKVEVVAATLGSVAGAGVSYGLCVVLLPGIRPLWWLGSVFLILFGIAAFASLSRWSTSIDDGLEEQ